MSFFSRLRRLRIPFASSANFAARIFAAKGAALSKRRGHDRARSNSGAAPTGGNIDEFGRRKAKLRSRARFSAARSSLAQRGVESEIAGADLVRFRSDLESMLASLSEAGEAGVQDRATAQYLEQVCSVDGVLGFGAPQSFEADVADAVRMLAERH